jgi:hypothetical protein
LIFVDKNREGPGVRLRAGVVAGAKVAPVRIQDLNAGNDE